MTVIDPPENIIKKALHANFKDIEDALQVYTALHFNMDCFITSDKKLIKMLSSAMAEGNFDEKTDHNGYIGQSASVG